MASVGIICEYNPFHLGHARQISLIRQQFGQDAAIVCLMSGSFVQRGEPAIFPRLSRARAAMVCGADLVLELPALGSLSSAEGFARTGVRFLSPICDHLCFGTESGTAEDLAATAEALLHSAFSEALRAALSTGISFPAARQAALEQMGMKADLLVRPNDILGVEYCKAILELESPLIPCPIYRPGDYHAEKADPENPSATALRWAILAGQPWESYLPQKAAECLGGSPVHSLAAGERAVLYRLRTMQEADFEALPYGSEGLWRRLMRACREERGLEDILTAVKTKRYTRTRLNRMVLCAFLGITQEDFRCPPPYARILAFNGRGRSVLKGARDTGLYRNLGWDDGSGYCAKEQRWEGLYELFRVDGPGRPRQKERTLINPCLPLEVGVPAADTGL